MYDNLHGELFCPFCGRMTEFYGQTKAFECMCNDLDIDKLPFENFGSYNKEEKVVKQDWIPTHVQRWPRSANGDESLRIEHEDPWLAEIRCYLQCKRCGMEFQGSNIYYSTFRKPTRTLRPEDWTYEGVKLGDIDPQNLYCTISQKKKRKKCEGCLPNNRCEIVFKEGVFPVAD